MKLLSAILVIISLGTAQTVVREPEFADVFFRVENGQLIALERQPITMKSGAHGSRTANNLWDDPIPAPRRRCDCIVPT